MRHYQAPSFVPTTMKGFTSRNKISLRTQMESSLSLCSISLARSLSCYLSFGEMESITNDTSNRCIDFAFFFSLSVSVQVLTRRFVSPCAVQCFVAAMPSPLYTSNPDDRNEPHEGFATLSILNDKMALVNIYETKIHRKWNRSWYWQLVTTVYISSCLNKL